MHLQHHPSMFSYTALWYNLGVWPLQRPLSRLCFEGNCGIVRQPGEACGVEVGIACGRGMVNARTWVGQEGPQQA